MLARLLILGLMVTCQLPAAAVTQWPLRVSTDGRFLAERNGAPHFPIIDTVWQLTYLSEPDVDLYLARRPAQGFNAVFVSLLGVERLPHGLNSTNYSGHSPFEGRVGAPDTERPNPVFFEDFKPTLRKLRDKNMTVFLVLGWAAAWQPVFSEESYLRYVEFVLDAYPVNEFPHVVFCLGGDKGMFMQKDLNKPMQIEAGRHLRRLMKARDDRRLIADHPGRGSTVINYTPEERAGWSDIIVVQSGHRGPIQDVPDWMRQAWEAAPVAPVFNGEPLYESHNPGLENEKVRWAHWVSVFSGACAVGYGGHGFWAIGTDLPGRPKGRPSHTSDWWKTHFEDQPVAKQVKHIAALDQSFPFRLAVPDCSLRQPLVDQRGQGAGYRAGLVAKDRSWALIYVPHEAADAGVALRLDALSGNTRYRWFDPTSGAYSGFQDTVSNAVTQTFTTPGKNAAGQRDWVLTVEVMPPALQPFINGSPYLGEFATGLYPDAKKEMPAAHRRAGERVAARIRPLDLEGKPDDADGRILALVMGHSNCRMYFEALQAHLGRHAAELNPRFEMLNAAVGGQQLPEIVRLQGPVWELATKLTEKAGYSARQVQVLFLHTTFHGAHNQNRQMPAPFPESIQRMQRDLVIVLRHCAELYPNLRIAYLTCDGFRHFTGFEPHVWQEAFALKWLIASQIANEPETQFEGADRRLPWLSWGPYIWDNSWDRGYFTDGVHPALKARQIFVEKYWDHLSRDTSSRHWLLRSSSPEAIR